MTSIVGNDADEDDPVDEVYAVFVGSHDGIPVKFLATKDEDRIVGLADAVVVFPEIGSCEGSSVGLENSTKEAVGSDVGTHVGRIVGFFEGEIDEVEGQLEIVEGDPCDGIEESIPFVGCDVEVIVELLSNDGTAEGIVTGANDGVVAGRDMVGPAVSLCCSALGDGVAKPYEGEREPKIVEGTALNASDGMRDEDIDGSDVGDEVGVDIEGDLVGV